MQRKQFFFRKQNFFHNFLVQKYHEKKLFYRQLYLNIKTINYLIVSIKNYGFCCNILAAISNR